MCPHPGVITPTDPRTGPYGLQAPTEVMHEHSRSTRCTSNTDGSPSAELSPMHSQPAIISEARKVCTCPEQGTAASTSARATTAIVFAAVILTGGCLRLRAGFITAFSNSTSLCELSNFTVDTWLKLTESFRTLSIVWLQLAESCRSISLT